MDQEIYSSQEKYWTLQMFYENIIIWYNLQLFVMKG